jgi:ABC-2 type transport system ATP-binding protein
VDMKDRMNDIVRKYSGGMRRRLEIARGLIHQPEILFLDEPTLGLDPQTREHMWAYIETLAKNLKMTIILTTHYMEEAEKLCNRIAIIDHGVIIALDTPANLKRGMGGDIVVLKGNEVNVDALKQLPFVKGIEQADHRVTITVEDSGKHLSQILKTAGHVDYVEMHSPDLNDVFLHYTGSAIREEEGGTIERIRAYTKAR